MKKYALLLVALLSTAVHAHGYNHHGHHGGINPWVVGVVGIGAYVLGRESRPDPVYIYQAPPPPAVLYCRVGNCPAPAVPAHNGYCPYGTMLILQEDRYGTNIVGCR